MANSTNQSKLNPRLQALYWLTSVIKDGRSVNDLLSIPIHIESQATDRAFSKQLLFGSLRYYHQLKAILDQLIEKPLKQKDSDVYAILILGVYQLRYLSVPDHAALSESVELTRTIKKPWASGLVNGILRNYQRKTSEIDKQLAKAKTYQFSHPNWIINQLEADWSDDYQAILKENNQRAPMTIRVDQQKISQDDYLIKLQETGLEANKHPLAKDALVLETACDVGKLPGFDQGLVSVQDAAPQLAVDLLDLKPNLKVLDGCSAPGGKTTHILQRQPDVMLTSVEMSAHRLEKIKQTFKRLNLDSNTNVSLKCEDILDLEKWWDGELFDRILIDVPCSASGVIRRNPDIKLHRKKLDLVKLVELQTRILETTWSLLKPNGRLVYATCSVFKDENERQIEQFLNHRTAELVGFPAEIDRFMVRHSEQGYQIFPGEEQMDGFYLCGLKKLE